MKIGIDISQVQYGTGVSNYTKNLVENLLKIDKKNEYILFGSSLRQRGKLKKFVQNLPPRKYLDAKILPWPMSVARIILGKFRIFPVNKFIGQVDVFHTSDWVEPRTSGETKKVTTVHDMVPYLFPSSVHPKIIMAARERLKLAKDESAAILVDSKSTQEDLMKFLEIPREKIHVVYLGVSYDFKPQDDDRIKEVLEKYKIKKPYILSVSTQEPRKNIQKLVDAYRKVQEEYPDFNLVLVGKHGWGQALESPLEASGKITVTGFVKQEDLAAVYSGARVFVYPSLYEGFGLPVLEAMACGTPVITSNNSSMAEIAKGAAILIDPRNEDQLIKALKLVLNLDLENYQTMVRESMNRAREYTWLKTAKETLRIYEEVAEVV